MKSFLYLRFYLFHFNLLSRFSLLYYIIILFINLYNSSLNLNPLNSIFDLKFNIHDTNSEIPDVNVDSNVNLNLDLYIKENTDQYKIPDFDQYTVKDVDDIFANGVRVDNKTLEEKLGTPYFWLRINPKIDYLLFKKNWQSSINNRTRYREYTGIRKSLKKIIKYHNDDKNKALPDIVKTLHLNDKKSFFFREKVFTRAASNKSIMEYLNKLNNKQ